ncbi:MAG TPA: methyltransferase domain-containing protein [Candidatus Nanoarchaeia archaeon]|nr:methyltransferase domain-containing protein [Candidatus Nanoarchaeia archaeon]
MVVIISSDSIRKIQHSLKQGKKELYISLDLGKTVAKIQLSEEGPIIEQQDVKLPKVKDKDKSCYLIKGKSVEKMQYSSPETGEFYKLIPTSGRPLLQISGTSMHKQPFVERVQKEQLRGNVLDAGTGLGYTAMEAAKTAKHVTTIEHDPTVMELQKLSLWSQELFTRKNITLLEGDVTQLVRNAPKESFDNIIYDAGTPRSSGLFFSTEHYAETYRVLKRNGKLYHYLPRPQIEQGRDFAKAIIQRLEELRFTLLERNEKDCYIIVKKL